MSKKKRKSSFRNRASGLVNLLLQAVFYRPYRPGPLWHDALSGTRIVDRWSLPGSDQAVSRSEK